MRILAVDDDALTLEFLAEVLRLHGYAEVSTAGSAAEAAEMITAAAVPFECFLLDIAMPEVDGIALCRWIRRSVHHRVTPILMTTALSDKPFIDRAFLAGASDYVTKPFDAVDLTTRLRLAEHQFQSDRAIAEAGQTPTPTPMQAHLEALGHVALSEPGALKDVAGLIDYAALENYLLQLARGSFFGTSVVALRIVDVGDIYAQCSSPLFREILADVAACAVRSLKAYDCVLSYAGNGIFAGVVGPVAIEDLDAAERRINLMIERLDLANDQGRAIPVQIVVGPPRPVGIMKSGRVAVALLRRAIEDIVWTARRPVGAVPKAAFAEAKHADVKTPGPEVSVAEVSVAEVSEPGVPELRTPEARASEVRVTPFRIVEGTPAELDLSAPLVLKPYSRVY